MANGGGMAPTVSLALEYDLVKPTTRNVEIGKSQRVRLFDIFVFGPFIIWYATKTRNNVDTVSFLFLYLIGIGTILYNLHNYLANE